EQELLLVVQVVAHHDGAAQVGQHVAGDLLERRGVSDVRVGDPVDLVVGDPQPRVDQGRVLVQDDAVAAHPHDPDLADPGALIRVQAGGFQVEDGEGQGTRVDAALAGEVP